MPNGTDHGLALAVTVHPARRIRVFVFSQAARRPAAGVPFRFYFETLTDDPAHPATFSAGFFESDYVGYLSAAIPSPNELVPTVGEHRIPPKLYLETLGHPAVRIELLHGQEIFHCTV